MQPHTPQYPVSPVQQITSDMTMLIPAIGAGALGLATLLPWLSSSGQGGESVNAFEKNIPWFLTGADLESNGSFAHGLIYLGLAIAALVVIWRRSMGQPGLESVLVAIGGAGIALGVLDFMQFTNILGDLDENSVSIGIGCYLAIAGAAAIVGGTLLKSTSALAAPTALAQPHQQVQSPPQQQAPPPGQPHQQVQPPPQHVQPPPQQQAPQQQAPPQEEAWWN